jgi:nucleoside 2-deoxyribosyltransferase
MKIYFAGSIRGGRGDAQLYKQIIELLKEYGEVLTEHIGHDSVTSAGSGVDPVHIFEQDTDWLREADVVVAEVTTPSLGVGYEIGLADSMEKRILCLYREKEDQHVSAMLLGNRNLSIAQYESIEDIANYLVDYF